MEIYSSFFSKSVLLKVIEAGSPVCIFVREIPISTRIPEDANIEAYYDGPGSVLEILVPKLRAGPEEHEVRVCLRPHLGGNDLMFSFLVCRKLIEVTSHSH
ncbi:unnamed protein product [Arabis nemorensis]|uniref:Hsps-like putative alpha-crystallin-like domain-containing protein n=1 Tax=Arabis nemorensis TaxID=586526 RepID=A0A565BKX5_9BRAS|nr:unnamed protein product [Arabis nemorensis]